MTAIAALVAEMDDWLKEEEAYRLSFAGSGTSTTAGTAEVLMLTIRAALLAEEQQWIDAEPEATRDALARQMRLTDSERERRVAAQEAITQHWQPTAERLQREVEQAAAALAVVTRHLPRHPMKGWPLPWCYDTLKEKIFAADGHAVCDFSASDRSEADELALWVVAVVNALAAARPPARPGGRQQTEE